MRFQGRYSSRPELQYTIRRTSTRALALHSVLASLSFECVSMSPTCAGHPELPASEQSVLVKEMSVSANDVGGEGVGEAPGESSGTGDVEKKIFV